MRVLAVNGGSSSLKFHLYDGNQSVVKGKYSRLGTQKSFFHAFDKQELQLKSAQGIFPNHHTALDHLISWLSDDELCYDVVVHRVVQGGLEFKEPVIVNEDTLNTIKKLTALAPDHLPYELKCIEIFTERFPSLVQVICFDTAFHQKRPAFRKKYAISQYDTKKGLIRYGFHGLSYEYIMQTIPEEEKKGKVIICHLGNGASIAAVEKGICQDTTMGFTPVSGLVMGTKTGELDPGVLLYWLQEEGLTVEAVRKRIHEESGLLALSGFSSDMRELLENEKGKEAVTIFCESVIKHIGALTAVLGGVDAIIFTAGIGENAPQVREKICQRLEYVGVSLDEDSNKKNAFMISNRASRVRVYVIPTNEELMMVRHAQTLVGEKQDVKFKGKDR